ncbi:MAG: helicase [Kiritimatiellae bacterium]|nr:helicase [Kiritimatiellia bacterium]
MIAGYDAFLATKRENVKAVGFDVEESVMTPMLFDWQRHIVKWALARGRAALFEDCGLGKTAQQVEWARHVVARTGRAVLILAPLAVADQTVREGAKFGVEVHRCRDASDVVEGSVNVTNYERLEKFAPDPFAGIVLDESSILKAYDGKTRKMITDFAKPIDFRLCCTATPAPNDIVELCNHAEFLDIMSGKEILALFFRQDGNTTHKWRLKGHAQRAFWMWMAEWSVAIRRPSDLGYSDAGYVLPALNMHQEEVVNDRHDGYLFAMEAKTLAERRQSRHDSLGKRVARAAELCNGNGEQWLVWCDLNVEGDALAKAIPDAVQVKGADSADFKEKALGDFATGALRVLVSKPSIAGFGMNFQSCHNIVFVGLSDSYEAFYQAIRRCWRFGQAHEVECYVICADSDGAVVENIRRKESQSTEMFEEVVKAMGGLSAAAAHRNEMIYNPTEPVEIPVWLRPVA